MSLQPLKFVMNLFIGTAISMSALSSASAFIDLGLPKEEQVPTSQVYVCEESQGGAIVISIPLKKLYLTEASAVGEGIPMALSDIRVARCPHTFDFNVDFAGQMLEGSLKGGCGAGGNIELTLVDPTAFAPVIQSACTYNP